MTDGNTSRMIEAIDLSKKYPDGTVGIQEVDFQVMGGEIFCLLGANGAGKTTTINLFFDFIKPTSGVAKICGIDANVEPLEAKKRAAYVSEDVALYPELSAFENVAFFARLGGVGGDRRKYRAALEAVGLRTGDFNRELRLFSKGMRQKVALAICWIRDADALFLDDPTIGLDPAATVEMLDILRGEAKRGKAVMMATHDLFRAREIADRVGIMRDGRLVLSLSRKELEGQDLEELYLKSMAG